jgi:hypothetical protein
MISNSNILSLEISTGLTDLADAEKAREFFLTWELFHDRKNRSPLKIF